MGRIIIALIIIPIVLGLLGAALPAFGYFPLLGGDHFTLAPFYAFWALPGIGQSIWLSLFTGLLSTAISLIIALILPGVFYGRKSFNRLQRYLAPLLSLPHVTVAVGILFLLQPSGWMMRLLSPDVTGYTRPPIWAFVPDETGLALVFGMVAKEVPFLVLMCLAALNQINTTPMLTVARSLGYGRLLGWIYIIIPMLWPRLKLSVIIVLVFSVSVVDMAVVLAPTTPPPLAVRLLTLFQDPDLSQRFLASAAAMAQVMLTLFAVGLWLIAVKILAGAVKVFMINGKRFSTPLVIRRYGIDPSLTILGLIPCFATVMGLIAAMLWSVSSRWRFPSAWPEALTLRYWLSVGDVFGHALLVTSVLGVVSAGVAVGLSVLWLQFEERRQAPLSEYLLFLPLMVPQVGFLFGLQIMLLWLNLDGTAIALVWAHLLFVLPYVWLSLAPAWRSFNKQWLNLAGSLGASPLKRFFRVRLPILIQPILTSFAVGFSVSAALYLPTVFAGNGRVSTLTVEAVTLASGAARSQLGVATGLQMALPLIVFILAGVIAQRRLAKFSYFS